MTETFHHREMTTLIKPPAAIVPAQENPESVDHGRRKVLASAAKGLAAAGAASLFPGPAPGAQ